MDVAQDSRVVGDQQRAGGAVGLKSIDAIGHDLEGIDVQTRVGLVQDGDLGLEELELQDLVSLLLASRKALIDAALGEGRIDGQGLHGRFHLLDP